MLALLHVLLAAQAFKLDAQLTALLIGTIIPLATAFLTKEFAKAHWVAFVDLILSAATGVLVSIQQAGGLVTKQIVLAALVAFVAAQASSYGVLEPTGASAAVASLLPNFGFGAGPRRARSANHPVLAEWQDEILPLRETHDRPVAFHSTGNFGHLNAAELPNIGIKLEPARPVDIVRMSVSSPPVDPAVVLETELLGAPIPTPPAGPQAFVEA